MSSKCHFVVLECIDIHTSTPICFFYFSFFIGMGRSIFGARGTRGIISRERGASPLLGGRARRSRPHNLRRGGHT